MVSLDMLASMNGAVLVELGLDHFEEQRTLNFG